MQPRPRHIRRLRLRVPSDDHVISATALLTDALRTATLPGADGNTFVVIRRLSLGRIPMNVSAGALALLLERAAADAASSAVAFDGEGAATADAVVFPGRGRALVALASRHAQHVPTEAWFWSSVVEGWHASPDRATRWRLLLDSASREAAAAVILASIVARSVAAQREHELLGSIREADAIRWLALCGWHPVEASRAHVPISLPVLRSTLLSRCAKVLGPHDTRLIWFATALAVEEHHGRANDPDLPARVAAYVRSVVSPSASPAGPQLHLPAIADRDVSRAATASPDALEMRPTCQPITQLPAGNANRGDARESVPVPRATEPSTEVARVLEEAVDPDGEFTTFAGLLFVVPILVRCGFADHLLSDPDLIERRLPERLLGYIARRARIGKDDPFAMLFPYEQADDDSELRAWMNIVRKWCRRHTCIGLLALIRRRGRVLASDTHLDVVFDLSHLDVRVRRVALDVNPGWVPWLGRVIQFTYTNSRDRAR